MYQEHFGLRTDPFPLYPSLKFVFLSTAFEEAMAHLAYGLEHEEDVILITGPIGTGKTLAVQSLLSNLSKLYRTAFVNVTQLDYPEVLKLVLAELGAPVTGPADRGDLLGALKEQVRLARGRGHKILIIVDEAQNLSAATLEGLRLLTNLGQPEGQAVQLVLVGQPDLEKTIRTPQLVQLRQRIRVHYRLETLSREETEAYIAYRLKVAGVERPLFKTAAIDLIHRASSGVPRLVNILCSRALLSAFVAGAREVDVAHVDLEELPPAAGVEAPASAGRAAEAPTMKAPAVRATAVEAPAFRVPAVPPRPAEPPVSPGQPAAAARPTADLPPTATAEPAAPKRPEAAAPAGAATAAAAGAKAAAPAAGKPGPAPARIEPMAAFRRRNRRGLTWFLLVLLLMVLAAVAVFSLRPDWPRPAPSPRPDAASRAQRTAAPARDEASGGAAQARPPTTLSPASQPADSAAAPAREAASRQPAAVDSIAPASVTAPASATGPAPATATAPPTVAGHWAVHVHSFQGVESASHDIAKFNAAGFPAFFRSVAVGGQQWERVYVGPFESMAEAQAAEQRLRQSGITTYALIVKLGDGS